MFNACFILRMMHAVDCVDQIGVINVMIMLYRFHQCTMVSPGA